MKLVSRNERERMVLIKHSINANGMKFSFELVIILKITNQHS